MQEDKNLGKSAYQGYGTPNNYIEYEQKVIEKIRGMILTCECPRQEKIVVGLDKKYNGHIFFSKRCIDWYINEVEMKYGNA